MLLRVGKDSQWIDSGGDQAITLNSDPLVGIRGTIIIDPLRLPRAITRREHPRRHVLLQSIRETQHFLLHRRREAADLVQDGFFESHDARFNSRIPGLGPFERCRSKNASGHRFPRIRFRSFRSAGLLSIHKFCNLPSRLRPVAATI